MTKKILFLTGTRADFGKLKSLMTKVNDSKNFESLVFITGMHMMRKYGMTSIEVESEKVGETYKYINQNLEDSMDVVLSKTIQGLSDYVKEIEPNLIVVHGDRVEALAGAIVGSLNNILVAHVEGGEVSGTIDELIRHSVSKLSHTHFVSNEIAKKRLKQLGEAGNSIFEIGSPDLDSMISDKLPTLDEVKSKYGVPFKDYAVMMYYSVTTELNELERNISQVVEAMEKSGDNYIVIYPNNDHGSDVILKRISRLKGIDRFRIYPSIRFEYFLTLLKNCSYMIGNSSAGVREVPFYGKPSINIGTRQNNRSSSETIFNVKEDVTDILNAIEMAKGSNFQPFKEFGKGDSDKRFIQIISTQEFWNISPQKLFIDM
jgi:UDP-N-acetylglucosamine 2-epimerase (hydrolysing)